MKWRWTGLSLALTAPFFCLAQTPEAAHATPPPAPDPAVSCNAAYAALPYGTILDLLDPDAPTDRRAAALEAYQRLSTMEECPEFAYTLGQLYRHGPDLPGNPLPQDVPRARELIRPMAEAGYLNAFADLAEMEMRHANSRETMKWTQVYLHFMQTVKLEHADADQRQYQRSAYNGNLLARAELIWKWPVPALPRRLVREDLDAYLAGGNGDRIAQRMRERSQGRHLRPSAQEGVPVRMANDPGTCYVRQVDRIGAASAAWIVEVLPSGETGRVVLENFVPNPEVTEVMKQCLLRVRFAPLEGTEPVTFRYPMVMGSNEGASLRRSRRR